MKRQQARRRGAESCGGPRRCRLTCRRPVAFVVALAACGGLLTDISARAADKPGSDLRGVNLRFVGSAEGIPLAGLHVEITRGYGDEQEKFGPFETDDAGTVEVRLPQGSYTLRLNSDKELPYLPVEVLWNKRSRGPRPSLNLAVRGAGVEKWLDGKQRDEGYEPPDRTGGLPRITYTLLPACELVLRAVDAQTGEGLSGAAFYTENALGEDWAHPIEGENLGAKSIPDDPADRDKANLTDDTGTFRRLVGANAGFKYGVELAPPGYERVEPRGEVEIDITYGLPRAEHVFKFRRIP